MMKKVILLFASMFFMLSINAATVTAKLKLLVNSESSISGDNIMMAESPDWSSGKDKGDGPKKAIAGNLQIWVPASFDNLGTLATDNLNGTPITIQTIEDTEYTFSFEQVSISASGRKLYFWDKTAGKYTEIDDSNTYVCTLSANQTITGRFFIMDQIPALFHPREVASGNWGTICYPELIDSVQGAVVYEIAGRNADASQIAVVPVAVADMEIGKPYLFNATADAQKFFYNPESVVEAPIDGACSLMGTFEQSTLGTDGFYVVKGQSFIPALGTSAVLANRAYLALTNISEMSEYVPQSQSSVAVRFFSVGRGSTTDDMQLKAADQMSGKYIQNGRFMIMREGKMYNA